jgi:hypothetical protein
MTAIDFDSTLIRRAKHVDTVQEFAEFADTLERRPITKLLGELPALAKISKNQFLLATRVIRRRYFQQPTGEQFELQSVGLEIAAEVLDADTSAQIRSVFTGDDATWRRGENAS